MNFRAQYVCIWIGLVGGSLIGIGQWALMDFMPPLNPSLSPAEVADHFLGQQSRILTGAIFMQMGYTGVVFLIMPLAQLLNAIERPSTFWTYMFLVGSAIGYTASFFSFAFWSAAAFRMDRPPELILLLNDVTALSYVALVFPAWLAFGALGFAILGDRSENPIFPRWIGYFNIWATIGSMPSGFVGYFLDGPFAWDGLVGFWIPVGAFFIWLPVMFWYMHKALLRLMREETA